MFRTRSSLFPLGEKTLTLSCTTDCKSSGKRKSCKPANLSKGDELGRSLGAGSKLAEISRIRWNKGTGRKATEEGKLGSGQIHEK